MIRGFIPWPTAYTFFNGKMVKFFKAEVVEKEGRPGEIIEVTKDSFTIACGKNALKIYELQFEGKNKMDAKSFLTGFKLRPGDMFG